MNNKYSTVLSLWLLFAIGLQAQNIIHPKIEGPNDLFVNSYNGVLFFGQTDLETQNTQMYMQLRFYYNSSANKRNYGYGLGFSLGWEMRYSINEIGGVIIETGDGRTDTFKKYGKDYEAPTGVFSILTQYENNKYCLTEKTGEKYYFDDPVYHKLTSMEDRYGNKTTLTYQDSLLVKIQDEVGHAIDLSYTDGMLTSAKASFHVGYITYEYDGLHRLKKRTDAMGNTTLYGYDNSNHINEITDAAGHKTFIAYTPAGMVSRMKTEVSDKSIRYEGDKTVFIDYTAPQNHYSYYKWDDKGRVIEKAGLCCGVQSKLEYDEDNNVVKLIDADGNITSYTYDNHGNMLSLTDPLGFTEYYTYEAQSNRLTSFTDRNRNVFNLSYSDNGCLSSITGPLNFSQTFTYDKHGWVLTTADANNNVKATKYNADGTIASVVDASGNSVYYTYDYCGNKLTETDANNNITTFTYNNNNKVISRTDALGNTTSISYDKINQAVRITNAKNQITGFTYDALGRLLSKTNPTGGKYTYTYDGLGNITSITDPMGATITQTWNEKNKIISLTNEEGERTAFDYDAKGNLIAIFQPNGNVIAYYYDPLDRIVQISDNIGLIAKYTYDGNGNQLTLTDGLDRTISYKYDELNRKISEQLPTGAITTYEYDNNSNILSVTDANGNITSFSYSPKNQKLTCTDALNAKTHFGYDANGNLCKVIDACGNQTNYLYDALNRNTQITFANGASIHYTYDELGNLIQSKDRMGNVFKYKYDALGHLLSKAYPDNSFDYYTYDFLGRMTSAVNETATIKYVYDRTGRLLSETQNGKVTNYKYDIKGGKRTLTYPSGMIIEEHLNARDLISYILANGEIVVSMEYNNASQKTKQLYANGISTEFAYNQDGLINCIDDNLNVLNYNIIYDAVGNITKRQNMLDSSKSEIYLYDEKSQLITFMRGDTEKQSFLYDALGNRKTTIENNVVTNYNCNNVNSYTSITGRHNYYPSFDGNGNMLKDEEHQYIFDFNNRIISADNNLFHYYYDALGRRNRKAYNGSEIEYYYAGDRVIEMKYNDTIYSYIQGNYVDEIECVIVNEEKYYYHKDHILSTKAITNSNSEIIEYIDYDPFGLPHLATKEKDSIKKSTINNCFLFTGREYDAETATYYYRSRTLKPNIGRFLQKDSLMYIDGLNDYSYVTNNPIIYVDPYGLCKNYSEAQKHCILGICIWSSVCLDNPPFDWPTLPSLPSPSPSRKCEDPDEPCKKLANNMVKTSPDDYNTIYYACVNGKGYDWWWDKNGKPHWWYTNGFNVYLGRRPW